MGHNRQLHAGRILGAAAGGCTGAAIGSWTEALGSLVVGLAVARQVRVEMLPPARCPARSPRRAREVAPDGTRPVRSRPMTYAPIAGLYLQDAVNPQSQSGSRS
ncbi:hypothetical protein [Streptomyces sp. NPDC055794]